MAQENSNPIADASAEGRTSERAEHRALVRVAVDAMGGDNAPHDIVLGAVQAARADPSLEIRLVGRLDALEQEMAGSLVSAEADVRNRITTLIASEVIEMGDHAAASVRRKQDSSIRVAARLVAEGRADAVVSAGNSGGVMAAAIFELKRIPGLERPAIGTLIPGKAGYTFMLDAGANTDVKPEWLAQFALLGDAYGRRILGLASPRVGLLSNGEEETKGNSMTVEAHPLLKRLPIDFVGNVEGKNLFDGSVDVVVTDGFTGNVALKTIEGVAEFLLTTIRDEAKKSPAGIAGGLLLKPTIGRIRARADWRQIGGAPLLGVNGVCIIAHGRSDAEAMKNAIIRGAEAVRGGVVSAMTGAIAASSPVTPELDTAEPALAGLTNGEETA
jgi:glycerol-3-phosphate acyltransferase PlsX